MIRAYHRHMADFCGQYPTRLKSMIVASTRVVDEAVREIREWGKSKWAVAVMPLLAKDMPADHPDLNPIWESAQEYDLPIANHSFTWNPPYYPGYEDLWENIFLSRLAAHPWGAMRFAGSSISRISIVMPGSGTPAEPALPPPTGVPVPAGDVSVMPQPS